MTRREEKRNLETIPVGSLGIIPLEGCKSLGEMENGTRKRAQGFPCILRLSER